MSFTNFGESFNRWVDDGERCECLFELKRQSIMLLMAES